MTARTQPTSTLRHTTFARPAGPAMNDVCSPAIAGRSRLDDTVDALAARCPR